MRQKRSPYLPLDRVLILSEEVLKLQCLLEFLEEQFNLPACFVEFCNRRCRPFKVVGKKHKVVHFSFYLDTRCDTPQDIGMIILCVVSR